MISAISFNTQCSHRQPKRRFALILAGLLLAAASGAVHANPVEASEYANATALFAEQRYAHAYGRFVQLADAGHVPSARMALAMLSNGPQMFNGYWSATPGQLKRWARLSQMASSGSQASALISTSAE